MSYVRGLLLRSTFAATAPRSAVAELGVVRRMRAFTLALATLAFAACETHRPAARHSFVAAPSQIDHQRAPSIEDYILALPPYSFHEETVPSFAARVRSARSLTENHGGSSDYLYCPGDGTWPTKEFTLERASQRLIIHVHEGPGPTAPYTTTMRRVSGGWIRGD